MKYRLSFILVLCIMVCISLHSQNVSVSTPAYPEPVNYPTVLSPQVGAMMRYDNSDINLNTGTVSQTIPLIDFEDPDFDLNVSITYSMDGFKPLQPDNFVGMGWRLNCIGVITREIYGLPDEFINYPAYPYGFEGEDININGYLSQTTVTSGTLLNSDSTYLNTNLRQIAVGNKGDREAIIYSNSRTELSPDIFRFNFGKHSGYFILDGRNVIVSSDTGQNYKISIGLARKTPNTINTNELSTITIITDDGYKYIFGGTYNAIEYTALRWTDFTLDGFEQVDSQNYVFPAYDSMVNAIGNRYNEPIAFHLSKIIAPNGREMIFKYKDIIPDSLHEKPEMMVSEQERFESLSNNVEAYMQSYVVTPNVSVHNYCQSGEDLELSYTLNKVALLTEISTAEQSILFNYESYPSPFFCFNRHQNEYLYKYLHLSGAKLTSVKRSYQNIERETTILSYKSGTPRLLLTGINSSTKGSYIMEYYTCDMDESISIDIDKWGYWNGKGTYTSFLPTYDGTFNLNKMIYNYIDDNRDREPSGTAHQSFMLQSIRFPTDGKIEYEYEPHDYSSYYTQYYENGYVPSLQNTEDNKEIAGGARLFKVTFDDKGHFDKRRTIIYDYTLDNGRSSGILKQEGDNYQTRYVVSYNFSSDKTNIILNPDPYVLTYSENNFGTYTNRKNGIGGYIEYSQVSEYEFNSTLNSFEKDSLSITSTSVIDTDYKTISIPSSIGNNGINENLSTWRIGGTDGVKLTIKKGGTIVKEHTFDVNCKELLFYPLRQFEEGNYTIYLEGGFGSQLSFEARYPQCRSISKSLPHKVSKFTCSPVIYEGRILHPLDKYESYFAIPSPIYNEHAKTFLERYYSRAADYSQRGGKLISEQYFGENEKLLKEITYKYQEFINGNAATILYYPTVPYSSTQWYYQILRIPCISILISEQNIKEHEGLDTPFSSTQRYTYRNGNTASITMNDSQGNNTTTSFTYPSDHGESVYTTMQLRNILSPIVTKTVKADSTEIIYRHQNQYMLLSRPNGVDESIILPVISSVSDSYGNSTPEIRAEYKSYDNYGNPLWIVTEGRDAVYIWGYQGTQLLAMIQNATETEVKNALEVDSLNDISILSLPSHDYGAILRSSLNDAMVTSYTYAPGVGISSITGPDGFTTYYEYDVRGRLSKTYCYDDDGKKSIIEKYEYHLVNQ